jgi:mannose-6-phosphate isomerase-like protein (cupin superfamily)
MSSKPQHFAATQAPAFVVKADKDRIGGTLNALGVETSVKISSNDSGGAYSMMETSYPPNTGPPLHLHHREDEWWYILEGNFVFEIDGERLHAGPGDTVFGPRGTRHTLLNIGSAPGKRWSRLCRVGSTSFFKN